MKDTAALKHTGDLASTRDLRIEAIRTAAIYLVVLIHFCNYYLSPLEASFDGNYMTGLFYNVFSRISVPLFFMISGAVAFRKDFSFDKNNNKIFHMLTVLIVWSVIYWLWNFLFLGRDMLSVNVLSFLFDPLKNHLWYMYAYIGLLIIQPFTALLVKHMKPVHENYFMILWLLLCGGVKTADALLDYAGVTANLEYKIPIIQGTYYLGYYLCGHIIYSRLHAKSDASLSPSSGSSSDASHSCADALLSLKTRYYIMAAALSSAVCFALTAYISIAVTHTTEKSVFGYSSLFIMLSTLCVFIAFIKAPIRGEHKLYKKTIISVGGSSFGIYLSRLVFFSILYKYADIRSLNSALWLPLLSLLVLAVSHIFVKITKRIPFLNRLLY